METRPLVSVIVVCRNPGIQLRDALRSVWIQRHVPVELIVVDGASTDGTSAWLKAQQDRIATLIIEPDNGVYDAMNKGVAKSTGDWVLFLGADDALAHSDTLSQTVNLVQPQDRVVSGAVHYTDGRKWSPPVRMRPALRNFVHHQGTFYRRSILGPKPYDEVLRYQGDYELNLRLWHRALRPRSIPGLISRCSSGGLSDRADWSNYREEILVRHRYYGGVLACSCDCLSIARFLRKKLRALFIQSPECAPNPNPREK